LTDDLSKDFQPIGHIPALDGLRAVAVVAVLVYHAKASWLPGGYLGVEVFFVLSGYLITSLLLAEWRETGHLALRAFWLRRARRLLPELFAVVAISLLFSLLFLRDEVAGLRADALAAAAYVTNWRLIFSHQSYFASLGRPSLLLHLWSLAVEEQFYLLWPPLLALSLPRLRPAGTLGLALVGIAGSAALMAALFTPGGDVSRLYYGSDTRATGVLAGAALAFIWSPARARLERPRLGVTALNVAGLSAGLGLAVAFWWLDESQAFLFRGGFLAVDLLTAVFLASVVSPQTRAFTAVLGNGAMRWLGTRSYAIYLWHWPVFMVTRPGEDLALSSLAILPLRLGLTLGLAEFSYRYVQGPVRSGAASQALERLRTRPGVKHEMARVLSASGVMAAMVLGVVVATVPAPEAPAYLQMSSFQGVVAARTASPLSDATPKDVFGPRDTPATVETATGTATTEPVTPISTSAPSSTSSSGTPPVDTAPPPPQHPAGYSGKADILAIGDSVMVGAANYLGIAGAVEIDAQEGRQASAVVSLLESRHAAGAIGRVVVIHIGNNGTLTGGQIASMMAALDGVQQVIFVNLHVDRPWQDGNNGNIASAAAAYPNVTVVDWHDASAGHPEYFWDDLHLRPAGADAYARHRERRPAAATAGHANAHYDALADIAADRHGDANFHAERQPVSITEERHGDAARRGNTVAIGDAFAGRSPVALADSHGHGHRRAVEADHVRISARPSGDTPLFRPQTHLIRRLRNAFARVDSHYLRQPDRIEAGRLGALCPFDQRARGRVVARHGKHRPESHLLLLAA
jgi:peptidoglycan/LPS O-acetylase OafA/YrhL